MDGQYAWIVKKRKGLNSKNRGKGGVGFLSIVKAYMCDRIEVIKDTKLWEKLWEIGIRGKPWRMIKNMTECAKRAAGRGNIEAC